MEAFQFFTKKMKDTSKLKAHHVTTGMIDNYVADTGLQSSELFRLEKRDINPDRHILHIWRSKNTVQRSFPMKTHEVLTSTEPETRRFVERMYGKYTGNDKTPLKNAMVELQAHGEVASIQMVGKETGPDRSDGEPTRY
ncbi:MAG TPA: hypothetical protein VJU02_01495 [Nitrospiraceae bacterium]|nr:hypothetical protein [Nitrospiraceae bacterium]